MSPSHLSSNQYKIQYQKWECSLQPDVALPLLVQPIKDSISEVGVRLIDLYLKTFKPKTRNIEHGTLHPLVALPHLRFTFSATNTKWEGDFQPDVALPLIVQPINDSISKVGVRPSTRCRPPTSRSTNKRFNIRSGSATNWLVPENLQTQQRGTLNTELSTL